MQQLSIRVLVSLAAVKEFMIFGDDVSQAYLQSDEQLSRVVYIRPKQEDMPCFSITKDKFLRVLCPLYGLAIVETIGSLPYIGT